MSKFNMLGGILCLGGLLLVAFQAISSVMTPGEIVWKSLSLVDVVAAEHLKWIDSISWISIQNGIKYITTVPLYMLLLCCGFLSILLGVLTKK